jgi:glutamyl-tRNA synthetase
MIRTRFAPSPTGYLHVGGLRTALYCYLFAQHNKGKFILRIEDTDQERYVEGALENLIKTLDWIGLAHDEGPNLDGSQTGKYGPYIQSQRTELYRKYADELIKSGHAYRCFCTKERLEEMRNNQAKMKQAPMYDRKCVDLPQSEIEAKIKAGEPFVIRQKIPYEVIKFKDLIRGNVQFDGKIIDDQVLMKSDGFPTYHLANVIDDHLMEITHVIRGEEWLPSTPKHIALYKAFGWTAPEFAHLPLLLNADKTKLSKRQGDVAVEDYIKKGYIREAIINFTAFLGWNPGKGEEKEIFSLEELATVFTLENVHKAGAIFNLEKLDWVNWKWQKELFAQEIESIAKKLDPSVKTEKNQKGDNVYTFDEPGKQTEFAMEKAEKLYEKCKEYLPENMKKEDRAKLCKALLSIEEKILRDPKTAEEEIKFYFELPEYNKELLTHEKMEVDLNRAKISLEKTEKVLNELKLWEESAIKEALLGIIDSLKIKNGQLLWPLRAALTGQQFSPGAFEVAATLGKEETLKRIQNALKKL